MNEIKRRGFLAGAAATGLATGLAPGMLRAQGTPTFRIGALNPVTGAGSPYGSGMQRAILLAAEEVNAAGGAGGRRLEIFAEDSRAQPQAAVLAAKKLIEVNQVQAILGTWSSGVSLAVVPLTNEANLIMMNTSGAPALSVPPANAKGMSWRFQATNDRFGKAFAEIAQREGFKRPATMAFNNASGIGNAEGFRKAWEAKGGKVVASVVYEPNRPSYRSELQQVLQARPDVIVTGSYLQDTTIILREWYQSGQRAKWIIPGWAANPALIKALGPEVTEGIISVDSVSNENARSYAHFGSKYQQATGQPVASNVYAAMTYDMTIVLALAMQAAGPNASAQQINAKLRDVANPPGEKVYTFADGKALLANGAKINYEGASSVLDFDEHGDVNPNFGAFFIEKGQLNRRYVVAIG